MPHYSASLDLLMSKVKKGQMTRDEYSYIANMLGSKNFLVFGTGHDSNFWRECNSNGITIFLEHDPKWILESHADTHLVNYSTVLTQYKDLLESFKKNNFKDLELTVPDFIHNISWDLIFVDGPPGNKETSIGRMQSIYMAKKLSNSNTEIFVHDCDRIMEDVYTKEFFYIKEELTKLRHCKNYD